MAKRAQGVEKASKGKKAPRKRHAEMVDEAIDRFGKALEDQSVKPTVSEFIKLIGLKKELQPDQPEEIRVTWVESNEEKPESGE